MVAHVLWYSVLLTTFFKTMQNISWCSLWPLNDDTVGADFCFPPLYSFCYLIQHYILLVIPYTGQIFTGDTGLDLVYFCFIFHI